MSFHYRTVREAKQLIRDLRELDGEYKNLLAWARQDPRPRICRCRYCWTVRLAKLAIVAGLATDMLAAVKSGWI